MRLCEDGIFDFETFYLKAKFICGVRTSAATSDLEPTITAPTLLIHLGFVTHGDVLDLKYFFPNIVETTDFL